MKLKIALYCLCLVILASCGSKKKTIRSKDAGVVLVEPNPIKLPSVEEDKHIKRLEKSGKKLNRYTLNYIKKYAPIAVREMHLHKIPASITLAQGVLESGSGRSELALKSNNHFGIKCHTDWQGERVYHDDDEKGECFRKYQYAETSFKDHSAFLTERKRYAFLFYYGSRNFKKWAKGLRKAGYATDRKYPDKLIGIIENYELHEFDTWSTDNNVPQKDTEKIVKPPYTIAKYYQVQKGDTLYSIAKKFKTEVAVLKELNGLKNNIISIGQHLLTK
ncbi:glucosaminidase domain-containing protein [Polaribacter sp.]|uniref:glucosaminidase domain-containing protein n=1 Tax=Polaribacter sp. TaxID=1920175 RepID=UPI003EF4D377